MVLTLDTSVLLLLEGDRNKASYISYLFERRFYIMTILEGTDREKALFILKNARNFMDSAKKNMALALSTKDKDIQKEYIDMATEDLKSASKSYRLGYIFLKPNLDESDPFLRQLEESYERLNNLP